MPQDPLPDVGMQQVTLTHAILSNPAGSELCKRTVCTRLMFLDFLANVCIIHFHTKTKAREERETQNICIDLYSFLHLPNHAATTPKVQDQPEILVNENHDLLSGNLSVFVGIEVNQADPLLLKGLEEEPGSAHTQHCGREPELNIIIACLLVKGDSRKPCQNKIHSHSYIWRKCTQMISTHS